MGSNRHRHLGKKDTTKAEYSGKENSPPNTKTIASVSKNTGSTAKPEGFVGKLYSESWKWLVGLLVIFAVLSFLLYLRTLSRSLPTGDSGDIITAAVNLGVPHPPGYPTITILGHLATFLPFGTLAFRVNLLSAILDSLALGVLGFGIFRLLRVESNATHKGAKLLIPMSGMIAGVGLLAVSTAFWGYSIVAEVFALNNILAALLLVLMLEWVRLPTRSRFLWFSGLFAGLALTNQLTIILLAPGLIVFLVVGLIRWRREVSSIPSSRRLGNQVRNPGWRFRDLGVSIGFFAIGLLPYLYLPLAASANPSPNWGDPVTLSNFWKVVMRSDYGTFSLTPETMPFSNFQQLGYFGNYFVQSFTIVGILLAIIGVIWFALNRRVEGLGLGLAFIFSGPIFILFASPPLDIQTWQGIFERFYILPSIPFIFFVAAGTVLLLSFIIRQAARTAAKKLTRAIISLGLVAVIAMPGVIAFYRLPMVDMRDNRVAEYYGRDLLTSLEPNSLLITMVGDENSMSVLYVQSVLGLRNDVVSLEAGQLSLNWYVAQQHRLHPDVAIPSSYYSGGHFQSLVDLISANLPLRPVYCAGGFAEDLSQTFDLVYAGLAIRLSPKGEAPNKYALLQSESDRLANVHFPERTYAVTSFEHRIADYYGYLAYRLGTVRQKNEAQPDAAFVERMYRYAIINAPEIKESYNNLGLLLWRNGGSPSEAIAMLTKYLQLTPNDTQAAAIRSIIATLEIQLRK